MAFHSSVHVDSITIPRDITGGQGILSVFPKWKG